MSQGSGQGNDVSIHDQGYRVPEVCRIVGISYRQLDYWARTGLVTPSIRDAKGSGTQRLYSFQDLVSLKVIKSLLDTGVSLQRVRKAVEYLHTMGRPAHGAMLMSDGHGVYEADSPRAVVDLLNQGQGVFAIAVDKVWTELEGTLTKRKPAARSTRKVAAAGS
jgi:DNA-binding transcriptional MerR regulator